MKISSWNIICFGSKKPIKVQFFTSLSALMRVHPNPQTIFETIRSGFIQILHHCSMSWKITPLYLCSSNLVYFREKEQIEKEFSDFWVVGWKFANFLMSYLKPQAGFSLNFASLFSAMRDNSSLLFSWNFIWFRQKEPIKEQTFRLLTAHVKFHQICTLIGCFYWKYIKFQLKKYRGVMSRDTEEWSKIWRKTELLFQK